MSKRTSMTRAEEVVNELKRRGLRCSKPEGLDDCEESYLEVNGSVIRLLFLRPRYGDLILVKLTSMVSSGCDDTLYSPRGLYVLAHSEKEAADRIISKIGLVRAQSSL